MQLIQRGIPPDIIRSRAANRSRRQMRDFWNLNQQERAQTSVPSMGFDLHDPELLKALAIISGGRCAFCEAPEVTSAHRFRPFSNALPFNDGPDAHLYYIWLADAWQNLHPICNGCVPREPQFPVVGPRVSLPPLTQIDAYVEKGDGLWLAYPIKERALLLDPCSDKNYEKHLVPKMDGELVSLSRRGETTIRVFELNRAERRRQRFDVYQGRLDSLESLLDPQINYMASRSKRWAALFDFNDDFSGTWYLLLRRIARWLHGVTGITISTTRGTISRFFQRLTADPDAKRLYRLALDYLFQEDQGLHSFKLGTAHDFESTATLQSIHIRNFKALEDLQLELVPQRYERNETVRSSAPALMILGENATGKSSVLEAVALAIATAATRDSLRLVWPRFKLDATQLGAHSSRLEVATSVHVGLSDGNAIHMSIGAGAPTFEGSSGQPPRVFAYGAFRQFKKGVRKKDFHSPIRNLFEGNPLPNPEAWLRSLTLDRFNLVIRTIRELLSLETDFDVIQRDSDTGRLRLVTHASPDGTDKEAMRTPFDALSSGYRSMLGMICDILSGLMAPQGNRDFDNFLTARAVVLIDEIEAHLHPRWKVQVMSGLRSALPNVTFIVTTHDPLCLRGMADGEVVVLQRFANRQGEREGQLPVVVGILDNLPPVQDLRIEQLLTSDFFQLLSTDDASAERRLAHIADLMAARARGDQLGEEDRRVISEFEDDTYAALPVGSSEVHRLIQEAVAEYLQRRRQASSLALQNMRAETKWQILKALEDL